MIAPWVRELPVVVHDGQKRGSVKSMYGAEESRSTGHLIRTGKK